MATTIVTGDRVQTPFGKGIVREVRNNGRLLVDVQGRSLVVDGHQVSPLGSGTRRARERHVAARVPPAAVQRQGHRVPTTRGEVDLHGLTVDEALSRSEQAISDAILADLTELRLVHGRTGGRIRVALHRLLRRRTFRAFESILTTPASPSSPSNVGSELGRGAYLLPLSTGCQGTRALHSAHAGSVISQ